MRKLVAVLDTNVWLSGLLWRGVPHEIEAISSAPILTELAEALLRPKFASRLESLDSSAGEIMEAVLGVVGVVDAPEIRSVVLEDPDDDKIIACGVAAAADWIVSGDRHLLRLKAHNGIQIGTPTRFSRACAERR